MPNEELSSKCLQKKKSKFYRKAPVLRSLFTEAVARRSSMKKVFLEVLQNLHDNTCARVSFFNKAWNFIKKRYFDLGIFL